MDKKFIALLKNNTLLVSFVLLGLIAFLMKPAAEEKSAESLEQGTAFKSVDTHIPAGFTLTPIEIANAEALSGLIGDVGGVVDLFLAPTENQKGGIKVGSRFKIMRAPLNPQQYAVLIKDDEVQRLMQYSGPFIAVVQNPEAKGSKLSSSGPSRVQIDYQN